MPVFEHPSFGRTGDDKFMVVIEVEDPKFDDQATPKDVPEKREVVKVYHVDSGTYRFISVRYFIAIYILAHRCMLRFRFMGFRGSSSEEHSPGSLP